ncbi:MAG: peptide-methionine (S)-S-oxide reductase MsrA, partial [Quisquiliibacterium sp.]
MNKQVTVLGGGCFWCLEAVFLDLDGVLAVESGYAGGSTRDPTYEEVCSGNTGHAEVVRVEFDADRISYHDLLGVFFSIHDPTTLNRQGNDIGTQYRSVIYYLDEAQRAEAAAMIESLAAQRVFDRPVVTELAALPDYYAAEDYHQRFFERNPFQGYCRAVVGPK